MRHFLLIFFLLFSLSTSGIGRNVMSWVPVYSSTTCVAQINNPTQSTWMKNGLTHLGLQFWVPGDNGEVVFLTDYQFTYKASTISQDVTDFVSWGNTNQVKIMLCLFNIRDDDFDWTYAQKVFNDYPYETVDNIMTIIDNYGLDGVDIDFEGVGNYAGDKNAYVAFIDTLGKALHASGKELSADMFPTPCYNFPNPSWESSLAPHVNFMNIMGYNDTYESDNTLFQYCPQTPSEAHTYPFRYSYIENYLTVKQGVTSSKLNYGIPAWVSDWGGQCAHENILDITDISSSGGLAIWNAELTNNLWNQEVTWKLIEMFKNNSTSAQIRASLGICGNTLAINAKQEKSSPIFYDSFDQEVHLSANGTLYLFSSLGRLEKSWNVSAGETIPLEQINSGLHIIKFETSNGLLSEKIIISNE